MPARCTQTAADGQRDTYWSIVSDLVSLIHRTRGYQGVNDRVQPAEFDGESAGEVVILDDVTPAQIPEASLLDDCNLRLREALHLLLEARASLKRSENDADLKDSDLHHDVDSHAGIAFG